jgi:type III pantothenate kinase
VRFHPARLKQFTKWATSRGDRVQAIEHAHIPLRVDVDEPEKVGIDRLLTATAAARRTPGRTLVLASVGTAITVDFVSPEGVFAGGAIFPGLRTMARSLHDYTAALPVVEVTEPDRRVVGKNTSEAIHAGVFWAAVGGIAFLATHGHQAFGVGWPKLYLTGGDGRLFDGYFNFDPEYVPTLTLEGVRLAAEGCRE